jgi:hypothetical protein
MQFVERPGGVSKSTGRAYQAFMACPGKNQDGTYCKNKPPKVAVASAGNSFQASVVLGSISAKLDTIINMLKNQVPTLPESRPLQNTSNGVPVTIDDSELPF